MTIKGKHTPGPWYRSGDHIREEASDAIIATVSDGGRDDTPVLTDEEIAANAHLIAAAPELLEALNWAMKQIGEPRLIKGQNDHHFNAWHAANAAIAKAEGRSDAVRKEN